MDKNNENAVQAWCEENDPGRSNPAPSILSAGPVVPAATGAVILGNTGYAEGDKKLGAVLGGNSPSELSEEEFEQALKVFISNPLIGCTSVLDMARVASGYDPNGDIKDQKNEQRFNDYLKRVLAAPFFSLAINESSHLSRREKSWEKAIDEIANLFSGVQEEDKSKVITGIKNLANAVASNKNTRQTSNLFTVSAIYAPAERDLIEAYLYSSKIEMVENKSKGSDSKQTELDIRKINLKFNIELWRAYARKVLQKHVKLVDDWLNDNTMHQGPEKANLCVGPYIQ